MPQCTGKKSPATQQVQRLESVLRSKMNVAPGWVVGADFQHHQIEGTQPCADEFIFGGKAGIAAEKHGVPLRAQHERGPESDIAVFQSASGKVLGRSGGHG